MVNEKIIVLTLKKFDEYDDDLRIPCHVNHIWPLLLVLASISNINGAGGGASVVVNDYRKVN